MKVKRLSAWVICLLPFFMPTTVRASEQSVLKQMQLLNRVPEVQVSEKTDPVFSILRTLYDQDGPDFLTLRKLLNQSDVRAHLNATTKCVLAGVISQRWDTFTISGNLYLAGLQSKNAEFRDKARKKLVSFIQPAHIPVLIDLLKVPGPNVLAYEVLQEVTGQRINPNVKLWQSWWTKEGSRADIIGHLLKDTKIQLKDHPIQGFDQERFWYGPSDPAQVAEWNTWVNTDVRHYLDAWSTAKPILERLTHQPDPRVSSFLERFVNDPGYGDYVSVVLAWRSNRSSLPLLRTAFVANPTVGRVLARGSLGDKSALTDLLKMIERHESDPLSYKIMDDEAHSMVNPLRTLGIFSAEQSLELLCHQNFEFGTATTPKDKKQAYKKAKSWLKNNADDLTLDARRGYFTVPTTK